jgi:phenylalanyl-tRNA synthetase beta chain
MKISREWLQTYFEKELPDIEQLADALTFHAFEIESVEMREAKPSSKPSSNSDAVLDVKITANRGHDCLSHRGIAKEFSAILDVPLATDPLLGKARLSQGGKSDFPSTGQLQVRIDDSKLCGRYIGAYIRGVKVGPSPDWLVKRLESIGQKSINNVVDAANFIMFDIGQPLHAFDAGKRSKKDGTYSIRVRLAHGGETLTTLDDKEQQLGRSMLMIADGHSDELLGVAGVKGGKESGVSDTTTDLILESANFDGSSLRRTSRALKFRTDATQRFEQGVSPELAAYGMRAFIELVLQVAGGALVGVVDEYPVPTTTQTVSVSLGHMNRVLGLELSAKEVSAVFTRLGFAHQHKGEPFMFEVQVPWERLDIAIPEDLIEEVGRIVGYDKIPAVELEASSIYTEGSPPYGREAAIREYLVGLGFSEVFTSVFAEKGERAVSNKIGGDKPYLRSNLQDGLAEALERNVRNKDLLSLEQVKIFEIGTVWRDGAEKTEVAIAVEKLKKRKTQEEYQKELDAFMSSASHLVPRTSPLPDVRYEPFSRYPFITRDIALWVSEGTSADEVLEVIRKHAGELLVRSAKFDEFTKDGRTSYAFRLVFQSMDRTLCDDDANHRMESIAAAVKERGWEVR